MTNLFVRKKPILSFEEFSPIFEWIFIVLQNKGNKDYIPWNL